MIMIASNEAKEGNSARAETRDFLVPKKLFEKSKPSPKFNIFEVVFQSPFVLKSEKKRELSRLVSVNFGGKNLVFEMNGIPKHDPKNLRG